MKLPCFFAAVVCWSLASLAFALSQNDAAHPKRLRIGPEVAAALLTHRVKPKYPESAQADHVSDDVFLRIVIDRQGKVIEAAPVSRDELPPIPSFTEDPQLCGVAMDAVKQWEYRPYLLNGEPVEMETQVVFKFKRGGMGGVVGGIVDGVPGGLIRRAAPPPNLALPRPKRVSSEVMEGNLLKHEDPVYPPLARVAKIQGEVRLFAVVSKTGTVENLRSISGHPILLQAAMDAVRHWKYKPFLLNGEPVEVESFVIVVFRL